MSINKVFISGNLTRDCEMRQTQGGTQVLTFGVAVNDRRRNPQSGQWEDFPNFIDCVMFGKRAESVSRLISKGSKVAIEGKLRWTQWNDKQGNKRSKIEVIVEEIEFLSNSKAEYGAQQQQPNTYTQQQQYAPNNGSQEPQTGYQQSPNQQQGYYTEDCPF